MSILESPQIFIRNLQDTKGLVGGPKSSEGVSETLQVTGEFTDGTGGAGTPQCPSPLSPATGLYFPFCPLQLRCRRAALVTESTMVTALSSTVNTCLFPSLSNLSSPVVKEGPLLLPLGKEHSYTFGCDRSLRVSIDWREQ